jgi:hypothetical protein
MKKSYFSSCIVITILSVLLCACSKNNDGADSEPQAPSARLILLQNKWILSSLKAYPTRDFSGTDFIGVTGNGTDYYNFRTNGKMYVYALSVYDTAAYKLMPNDSTLLVYGFNEGVKASVPDTAIIIKLTTDSLSWWHKNAAGDYAKFSFVK